MTTLEIILLSIIWIGYGIIAAIQTESYEDGELALYLGCILFSPIVFIGRCLYGAFKKYEL